MILLRGSKSLEDNYNSSSIYKADSMLGKYHYQLYIMVKVIPDCIPPHISEILIVLTDV